MRSTHRLALSAAFMVLAGVACSGDSVGPDPNDPGPGPAPTVFGTYVLVSVNAAALPASLGTGRIGDTDYETFANSGSLTIGQGGTHEWVETQQVYFEDVLTGETSWSEPIETVRDGVYTIDGVNMVFITEVDQALGNTVTGVWDEADAITVTDVSGIDGDTNVRRYLRQ